MKKRDNILRLKYRLEPKENDVVEFQILEQDESLRRDFPEQIGVFNGIRISSYTWPYAYVYSADDINIVLRGSRRASDLDTSKFKGHKYIPSIHKALKEMVKKVFGNCTVVKG